MSIRYHTPLDEVEQRTFGVASPAPLAMADQVRFAELDVLNHVNNAVYMQWFERVRVRYTQLWGLSCYLGKGQDPRMGKLIRVADGALGLGRPMPDLMLGPFARLYHKSHALQRVTGHAAAFVPIDDFIDGINIVELQPQTPVQVFQLGFDGHERFAVNGVEVDSQNPGARHDLALRGDMLALYLSLFPHMERLDQFGMLLHPRMSLADLDFGYVA